MASGGSSCRPGSASCRAIFAPEVARAPPPAHPRPRRGPGPRKLKGLSWARPRRPGFRRRPHTSQARGFHGLEWSAFRALGRPLALARGVANRHPPGDTHPRPAPARGAAREAVGRHARRTPSHAAAPGQPFLPLHPVVSRTTARKSLAHASKGRPEPPKSTRGTQRRSAASSSPQAPPTWATSTALQLGLAAAAHQRGDVWRALRARQALLNTPGPAVGHGTMAA